MPEQHITWSMIQIVIKHSLFSPPVLPNTEVELSRRVLETQDKESLLNGKRGGVTQHLIAPQSCAECASGYSCEMDPQHDIEEGTQSLLAAWSPWRSLNQWKKQVL